MGNLIIYGILALGVITFVGGALHKYNSAITKQVELKTSLDKCSTDYSTTLRQVTKQNDALKMLREERDLAQQIAADALKAANREAAARKPERERLAALERTFKAQGPCPAGEAVSEYRKGLKP